VGFDAPIGLWFRRDLKDLVTRIFSQQSLQKTGIFNPQGVQALLQEHLRGKRDLTHHLWAILVFETWFRMYLLNNITEKPTCSLNELFEA